MSRLVLALLVGACNHPPSPTPVTTGSATADAAPGDADVALDRDLPKLALRALALYKDVAQAFVAAGEDCPAAIAKLGALQSTYADVVAANAKVLREHRAKELRAALAPYQDDFDAAAQSIMGSKTLATCAPDKAFEQAFDRLVATPP